MTGFNSFPSGHSANAMRAIWLSLLAVACPKLEGKGALLFVIGFCHGLLVMFSRVVMGAHFTTDVVMGGLITISIFWLELKFVDKKIASRI